MAWTRTEQNNSYNLSITSAAVAMASAAVNSDVIDQDLSGTGCILGIQVTIAGSDVASNLILQCSPDGTNWITAATLSSDVDPHLTGYKLFLVDLTAISAPWFRLSFNNNALPAGTTGRIKFIVCASQRFEGHII